ncbi:MAG: class F sortase [bacterium]
MLPRMLLKWLSIISAIIGVLFSVLVILLFTFDFLGQNFKTENEIVSIKPPEKVKVNIVEAQLKQGLPFRLKIPGINVDSAIEHIGLTSQGEVGVTKGPTNVAWYDLGPRPGDEGSAVISGHYGWKDGIPAVFDNLYKLKKGDKVIVEDERGVSTIFVVRESRRYNPSADASYVFEASDVKSHLNLITCEGVWSEGEKSYSKRLVVFTDKE